MQIMQIHINDRRTCGPWSHGCLFQSIAGELLRPNTHWSFPGASVLHEGATAAVRARITMENWNGCKTLMGRSFKDKIESTRHDSEDTLEASGDLLLGGYVKATAFRK